MLTLVQFHQNLSSYFENPKQLDSTMESLLQKQEYAIPYWLQGSLFNGMPGIAAYLIGCEHHENAVWSYLANSYKRLTTQKELLLSYGYGLTGLSVVVSLAKSKIPELKPVYNNLNAILLQHLPAQFLIPGKKFLDERSYVPPNYYNFSHGLSGILKYLIDETDNIQLLGVTKELIEQLSQTALIKRSPHPFFITPQYLPELQKPFNPDGGVYLSTTIGISGPLSVLSSASLKGITTPHLQEAIFKLSSYLKTLVKSRIDFSIIFPFNSKPIPPQKNSTDSYLTGWPNIVRSLYLAGLAIKDTELTQFAKATFTAYFDEAVSNPSLQGVNFGAGIAGFASISKKMFEELRLPNKLHQANSLLNGIIEHFSPEYPLGFKVHFPIVKGTQRLCSAPGILYGSTGIGLALQNGGNLLIL